MEVLSEISFYMFFSAVESSCDTQYIYHKGFL